MFKSKTGSDNHLKCTTSSDGFICIEGGADVFREKTADLLFDCWDSCGSSNYLYSVNVIAAQLCQKKKRKKQEKGFFIKPSNKKKKKKNIDAFN